MDPLRERFFANDRPLLPGRSCLLRPSVRPSVRLLFANGYCAREAAAQLYMRSFVRSFSDTASRVRESEREGEFFIGQ